MSESSVPEKKSKAKSEFVSYIRETVITLLIALIVLGVMRAVVQSYRVEGASMNPSFLDGQYVLVNKLIYRFHPLHRGDVIVFWPPTPSNKPYIKRVVGLPGEKVSISNGEVYINGVLLDEPSYIPYTAPYPYRNTNVEVPQGSYFVLGDNRGNSSDSRFWGFVSKDNIIGSVWISYWPPGEWGLSPSYAATLEANPA